jgi:hypothetical protein
LLYSTGGKSNCEEEEKDEVADLTNTMINNLTRDLSVVNDKTRGISQNDIVS